VVETGCEIWMIIYCTSRFAPREGGTSGRGLRRDAASVDPSLVAGVAHTSIALHGRTFPGDCRELLQRTHELHLATSFADHGSCRISAAASSVRCAIVSFSQSPYASTPILLG